ncbi:uncharacterized protein N7503_009960 [Penicillium pulvis]|uniref:uncharacterized protein n=1 Tax=Penicillium pulvis TaxID=1562058 RepID=UPI002548E57F|nr:uncharacterized protein N7503_009960 [Penicillium pulvis]KAJ5784748.1 hypothetical protein N7503_009960 [Penicillium pulvis]
MELIGGRDTVKNESHLNSVKDDEDELKDLTNRGKQIKQEKKKKKGGRKKQANYLLFPRITSSLQPFAMLSAVFTTM